MKMVWLIVAIIMVIWIRPGCFGFLRASLLMWVRVWLLMVVAVRGLRLTRIILVALSFSP